MLCSGLNTMVNLLERCEVLSFNLSERHLHTVWEKFTELWCRLTVAWSAVDSGVRHAGDAETMTDSRE